MSALERFQNHIAGTFVDAVDGRTFDSLDPYAGAPWAAIPEDSPSDIDHAVAAARAALDGGWGAMTGFQRAALMPELADLISANAERPARVEVRDNGFGHSGLGRENGADALDEYTEVKSVWVELTGATRDPFTLR